jgi:hypothetical protein
VRRQQATVDDILTGRENLVMWGRLFHLRRRAAARRADELLEQLGPTDAAEGQPGGGGHHVGSARTVADARVAGHARGVEPAVATVSATRELFGNGVPELVGTSWPAQNALLLAVVWPVVIVAVFLPLAVRRYHATAG